MQNTQGSTNKRNNKIGGQSNVFAVGTSQAQRQDRSYYKSLYNFDANAELAEYTLPVLSNQIPSKPAPGVLNAAQLAPIKSGGSQASGMVGDMEEMEYDMNGNPLPRGIPQFNNEEYDDEEEEDQDQADGVGEDGLRYEDFEKIINTEGQTNNQVTELRKANFIRKNTASWNMVQAIQTGDQAISFFAKHGTNMPIKFLNCNRKPVPPAHYRPYDLIVIEDEKALDREYFTISAQGVVQVQNEKRRKKGTGKNRTPTEFLSLSDWMQQQTMFNVLTSMKFFKHYLISKIFGLWKGNVRYRTYNKTRQLLAKSLIQARPDYQPTFMEINRILYDMQVKTTYFVFRGQKNYEIDDFNTDQGKHRHETKIHYNDRVDCIITEKLMNLTKAVGESRTISDQEDLENTKIGQAAKNKSMVLQKMEDALKNRVIKLAWSNYNNLGTFIRLIDYMVVETQVRVNQEAAELIISEMDREDRKYALQTVVGFDNSSDDGLQYSPTKAEITNHIENLLTAMQTVTEEVQRVINHNEFHAYIHGLITDSGPRFRTIVDESAKYRSVRNFVLERIATDFSYIEEKTKSFKQCKDINEFDIKFNFDEFKAEQNDQEKVKNMFDQLAKWDNQITKSIKLEEKKGLIVASGRKIREKLQNRVKKEQENLRTYLFELAEATNTEITKGIQSIKQTLTKPVTNLNSYVEFVNKLQFSKQEFIKLGEKKKKFEEMKAVLGKYRIKDENAYTNNSKISQLQTKIDQIGDELIGIEGIIKKAEEQAVGQKDTNNEQLTQQIQAEQEKLVESIEKIESDTLMSKNTDMKAALLELTRLKKRFDDSIEKIEQYRSFEQTLAVPQAQIPQIEVFQTKFNRRQTIWQNRDTFDAFRSNLYNSSFKTQDAEAILKVIQRYAKENMEMKMKMAKDERDEVLEELTKEVKYVEGHKNLILALGSKAMQARHWSKVFAVIDQGTNPQMDTVTLDELVGSCNAMDHIEEIEDISGAAQGEMQIENTMKLVDERWAIIDFVVVSYRDSKDRFIITEVEDLITQLEDDTMTVSTMMGSKFVAEIKESVERMEKKLVYLAYVIDEWLKFQRQWMYLENIFNAEDIIKQLPAEAKMFQQVDKQWKEHMTRAKKSPKALDFASDYEVGVNLKKFIDNNKKFDEIQKCLEEYLSTKRAAFPRFYFLSNDEMLEILSQTRNAHAVQPHLIKCFDSIKKIEFSHEPNSKTILGMFSPESEYVTFTSIVKAEGNVEFWLTAIEKMMTQSLFDNTRRAVAAYPANGIERAEWLFHTNAQSILTVDMIMWTQGVEAAIYEIMKGKNSQGLKEFLDFSDKQLKNMIKLVRGKLDNLQRTAMGALIVLDVHAIEVVRNMIAARVENINDFPWTSQLRYYWEPLGEKDGEPYKGDDTAFDCFAKQTITRFRYSYEYLGNGPRLVITPLTDQCYMTLTGALHLFFGGNPAGPAGTGKTETTKDLAKALAVQCVVFNCSDGLEVHMMSRFFTGLSSGGAWACFDEFNRINIEVLSVIAQQILTIQSAVKQRLPIFNFEGKDIPLNLRFGVFITMNPGYAGRTELPDNLKALFRPMAMMIPDYRLIAEISLYSEGFETAKELSRKMVKLYSLSSEQLSKQDHYDFGMRAVKSVLVMAGKLRRKDDTVPEDILLIRAMRDSNVPKFLEHDLPLFRGIIKDLFPSVVVPFIDYGKLQKQIEAELRLQKLQTKAEYITKVIQLLETMTVRHGNMLVGTTGTGKTTVAKILGLALTSLNKQGEQDYWYKPVKISPLNPKAVTMGELFGEVSKLTNEWTEGVIPWLVKEAVAALETKDADWKRWIIFDGPVDALWIENMNTVLDDNKMLCLNNGQRIKMPETCTMMFEVNDLKVASPATVSRCGMVYLEPEHLGWQVLVKTWHERMAGHIEQPYLDNIVLVAMPILDKLLTVIRKQLKQTIESQDCNLISSFLNMVHIFLNREKIHLENRDKVPHPERTVFTYVSFCLVWSLGANLHDSSRQMFGEYIRNNIRHAFPEFPDGDVFEYGINQQTHTLQPWNEQIPVFQYNPKMNFFDILVPTNDTVKYKYILNTLMYNGYNCLFSGETGVGKSVIVKEFLMTSNEQIDPAFVNFSGKTTCRNLQDAFEGNLDAKRKNLLAPKVPNTRKIFFIDDVNMPQLETYFAQPPCELLRQTIDQGGFYDVKKLLFKKVQDTKFIAGCAPPGGGRNAVTPRLFRHFNMIWIPDLSQASMKTIFTSILKGNLELKTGTSLAIFAEYIIKSAVQIYSRAIENFLPTPTKCHYTFNLRDLSKVVQGMLMCKNEDIPDKEYLVYLYISETYRVFRDRLIDDKDRQKFSEMSHQLLEDHLSLDWNLEDFTNTIFGDFETNERKYVKLSGSNELIPRLDELLSVYNTDAPSVMNLVFFEDCIQHLARIARILRQQRGNAMLVGVGGSGRSSMAKLAASINSMTTFSIEITKSYRQKEWYEDIKKMLRKCGLDEETVQFLFSDTQIVFESFLEDINNLLNSGEIPNLFPPDEKINICDELADRARSVGKGNSRDEIYAYFVSQCRERLHIVLAFSPVGDQFRNRCRQFPSIINCCTIDWYNAWPPEALFSVAIRQYQENEQKLGIQDQLKVLSDASVFIHESVKDASELYFAELRRRNYTTPTSYLDLIKTYIEMLGKQKIIVPSKMTRYQNGLSRLAETNVMVDELKKKLIQLMPVIDEKSKATQLMVIDLEAQTADAAEIEKTTAVEEAAAKKIFNEVSGIKSDCQAVLAEAMPALKKALAALDTLNKGDIGEMKNYATPPEDLVLVMDAVCVLLDRKQTGWPEAKALMNNPGQFIESLQQYDKDKIPARIIKKLKKYVEDPRFVPDLIAKKSVAGKSICMFVLAMDKYSEVKKIVEPKEAKLAEAEKQLEVAQADLKQKQQKLQVVRNKINQLQNNYKNSLQILEDLNTQKNTTEIQLGRAEKLVNGLHEESIRWGMAIQDLEKQLFNLTGNMLISAGYISYVGTFTQNFRNKLVKSWMENLTKNNIPFSNDFTIEKQLGDPVVIRDWLIKGLPADSLSISNGIIATTSKRWPLIIDPQSQGNKWIKNMEKSNNHKVIKLSNPKFLQIIDTAIRMGFPVLLENVEEKLDPSLEPLLIKNITKVQGQMVIKLGDSNVPYNNDFKFFITTKLANPHYLPEVCIKVTLINFTVTPEGLEDQLLVEVVRVERPELEQQKDQLIVQLSDFKRQLKELEDKILKLVAEASDDILNDEELITTLDQSKETSIAINERMIEAEQTAKMIDENRENYRVVARRGSVLYFVVADLANIDPMYQYSLEFFTKLFIMRLEKSEKSTDLEQRLQILISDETRSFYFSICRGLFEKDKLLYSFLNASSILRRNKDIDIDEWNFFLRGSPNDYSKIEQKIDYIDQSVFVSLNGLEESHINFKNIIKSFEDTSDKVVWKSIMTSDEPHLIPLPPIYEDRLSQFQKCMLLKILRPGKLIFAIKNFVKAELGAKFIESPPFDLDGTLADSVNITPIIFVLSPGADPIAYLNALAAKKGKKCEAISLGQGQGSKAEKLIQQGQATGDWVCLQNCHLSASWMPELEKIQELQDGNLMHPDYRLWLTSAPSPAFPVPVLQGGLKLTNEPPKGLKANMTRSLTDLGERYEGCTKPKEYKKLVFALAYFHAAILERRKYGAIGWNIAYEWMNSDFNTSELNLRMYLDEQPEVPYIALNYLIAQVNYGGRVTDDKDIRCIKAMLKNLFRSEIMQDGYKLSKLDYYYAPPEGPLADALNYVSQLPLDEDPEVFGLHTNANIAFELKTVGYFMDTVLIIQPRASGGKAIKTPEEIVTDLANAMAADMPDNMDLGKAHESTFALTEDGVDNSLGVFVKQEIQRFNRLLSVIKSTLRDLVRAIAGTVVMSMDLEKMFGKFLDGKVPDNWTGVGYPCLKPLGSWMKDMLKRIQFISGWLYQGPPNTFWVPAFFFPQGFITATMQTYARKNKVAIDTLAFRTNVMQFFQHDVKEKPEIGVYIHGLYMQGSRWDPIKKCVDDSQIGIPIIEFPVIWLEPILDEDMKFDKQFSCPLYKTSIRAGELSTTGHSTNFVMYLAIPSERDQDYWIRRGAALLCMTDD